MAGIYGPIVEHPEVDINDEGRFTVTIVGHPMNNGERLSELEEFAYGGTCKLCGFPKDAAHHGKDFPIFIDMVRGVY